MMMMTLMICW